MHDIQQAEAPFSPRPLQHTQDLSRERRAAHELSNVAISPGFARRDLELKLK